MLELQTGTLLNSFGERVRELFRPRTGLNTKVTLCRSSMSAQVRPVIIITLFSLIISLVGIELLYRVTLRFGPKPSASDRPSFYAVDPQSNNLQDNGDWIQAPPDTFRIAVVGDSIAFGPHLQSDDTFPKRLERFLSRTSGVHTPQVINLGFPGFSTANEVPIVSKAIERGVKVIILEMCLNDAEVKLLSDPNHLKFGQYTPSASLRPLFTYWKSLGAVFERIHNSRSHNEYRKYFFDLYHNPETWEKFKSAVHQIVLDTRNHEIPFLPVLFPLFGEELGNSYPFIELHEKIRQLFKSEGIELLDLLPVYRGIPPMRLQVIPGGDLHPNEIAHRIAAETIYGALLQRHIVPAEFEPVRLYRAREDLKQPRLPIKCVIEVGSKRPKSCQKLDVSKGKARLS